MIKVLVVIDNLIQYERIKNIVERHKKNAKFIFKHSIVKSAIWDHDDFQDRNECVIDVVEQSNYIINNYDLVLSVHCFQFFPRNLVENIRCINLHPGYNPINRGWYPQVFSIINNLQIGATLHEMDEKLDNGPIIARALVDTYIWDTSLSLYNRVLEKEIELLNENLESIIFNSYSKIQPENKGNMFRKSDFENFKELDLNEFGNFKSFYDRLRALSHGDYKNCFIKDPSTDKKIFLRLEIEHE